jgi:DNA-binding Lrp family transcriptional regulator
MQTKRRPVRAFILIHVKAGRAKQVAQSVGAMPGVQISRACWGVPDVIAYAEVSSQRELDDLVTTKIQELEGVERTDTHIALD